MIRVSLIWVCLNTQILGLKVLARYNAKAVRPDVVNAKYHVITNATYNRDPVPAKFKHVTNIEICTLLCCDYSTLWEALHANKVEIDARCSDKNVKILVSYQWIGWKRRTKGDLHKRLDKKLVSLRKSWASKFSDAVWHGIYRLRSLSRKLTFSR